MKTPPLSFAPGTVYVIKGREVQVKAIDEATGNVCVVCPLTGGALEFPMQELMTLRMKGKLTVPNDAQAKHVPSGRPTLKRLTQEQRTRVVRRTAYARTCAALYPVGPMSMRLKAAIDEVATRIQDPCAPSPHSVYRWMRRFILSNYDTAVFFQDAAAIRQRSSRIEPKAKALLREEIQTLLGKSVHATLNGVMNEALARVAKQLEYLTFTSKEGEEFTPDEFLAQLASETLQPLPGVQP